VLLDDEAALLGGDTTGGSRLGRSPEVALAAVLL
jgi:hypothetical protein